MCAHPENQLGVIEGGTAAVCGVERCKVGLVLAFQRDDGRGEGRCNLLFLLSLETDVDLDTYMTVAEIGRPTRSARRWARVKSAGRPILFV